MNGRAERGEHVDEPPVGLRGFILGKVSGRQDRVRRPLAGPRVFQNARQGNPTSEPHKTLIGRREEVRVRDLLG